MTTLNKTFLIIGALFLMTATMLSAYGLHGLADSLTEADRLSWRWATQIQTYQGLGLVLITLLAVQIGGARLLDIARGLFVIGVMIFSGGIYLKQIGISDWLSAYAPFGGGSIMLAWGLVVMAVILKK